MLSTGGNIVAKNARMGRIRLPYLGLLLALSDCDILIDSQIVIERNRDYVRWRFC